jgi:hypothetical protein
MKLVPQEHARLMGPALLGPEPEEDEAEQKPEAAAVLERP